MVTLMLASKWFRLMPPQHLIVGNEDEGDNSDGRDDKEEDDTDSEYEELMYQSARIRREGVPVAGAANLRSWINM